MYDLDSNKSYIISDRESNREYLINEAITYAKKTEELNGKLESLYKEVKDQLISFGEAPYYAYRTRKRQFSKYKSGLVEFLENKNHNGDVKHANGMHQLIDRLLGSVKKPQEKINILMDEIRDIEKKEEEYRNIFFMITEMTNEEALKKSHM